MRKVILIALLCAPLAWTAWCDAGRFAECWRTPVAEPADDGDPADPKVERVLKDARAASESVLKLPEEVVRAAVTLDDLPEGAAPPAGVSLAVVDLGKKRVAARKLVREEQDRAAGLVRDIDAALAELRGADGRPRKLPDTIRSLEGKLAEYERLPVKDRDRLDSARAQAAWPDTEARAPLKDLDELYQALDRWADGGPDASLPADTAGQAAAYSEYLEKYGAARAHDAALLVKEAQNRLQLWTRGAALVNEVRAWGDALAGRPPSTADAAAVARVAELATRDAPPARFTATARRIARILAARTLPEEKLDPDVIVRDQGVQRPIPRDKLTVVWKVDQKYTTLAQSGKTEFEIKNENLDALSVSGGTIDLPADGSPALEPTEYSKAVYAFNRERANVKWRSADELARLQAVCAPNRAVLERGDTGKSLIARIDALVDVLRRYPQLFAGDSP